MSPGIRHTGIPIGLIDPVHVPGRGTGCEIDLVVQRPHPHGKIPVQRACGHIESRRQDDELCAHQRHPPGLLRKAHVIADGHADFTEFRIHHRDLISGRQGVRLHEPDAALYVDVEEVDLPVGTDPFSGAVKNVGGVVDLVLLQFRDGPADQVDPQFLRDSGQRRCRGALRSFRILPEVLVGIGAVPHFRQADDIRAAGSGFPDHRKRLFRVFLLVHSHQHLAKS